LQRRASYALVLPDDLMHVIFSQLDMMAKFNAGLACKNWDPLLRAATPAARHWVIDFNVDKVVPRTAFTKETRDIPCTT
jgi:hypothetical protein